MKPRLMAIEWIDSAWNTGVSTLSEMAEFEIIKLCTVGIGIEMNDRYVLAKESWGPDSFRHITAIPKVNIVKVSILRYSGKVTKNKSTE